ncbi:Nuclear GTPase SLIP-GC [Colletotrichum sp. SAR 10_99]|nr:Nuclear GTPase SLIP-GC [Colletotrichum sp. SAR 10_99]
MPRAKSVKAEPGYAPPGHNASRNKQPSGNITFPVLDRLEHEKDPKVWEKHIDKALPILERLEPVCKNIAESTKLNMETRGVASNWVRQIATVRKRAVQTNKITIGVFGNTGDGKSSTINALLGEANLLPTNCMRACTACVTEISYNDDDDDENPYKAEIDFVSPDEWIREIKTFLDDVTAKNAEGDLNLDDEDDDEEEESNDSDEGQGEENLDGDDTARSVAKARAVYANMDNEVLLESSVHDLMRHPNVHGVLGMTQTFKAQKAEELREMIECYIDSTDENDEEAVAYWPLVKAVRIFTKAEALSNGVTIADLPGTHDADAARSSMAREYMRSCAGIWIVAPIDRAVDNKAARDLMSDNFKCQLNLDGSFSSVTFICSKTDHINLNDAVKNLKRKLKPGVLNMWQKSLKQKPEIKNLENKIKKLQTKSRGTNSSANDSDQEQPRKRTKISELEECRKQLDNVKDDHDQLVESVRVACIDKRNELSRDTLKNYFTRVMKEARQQTANRKQDAAKVRIDNKISNNLPVFCTSSHAYQSMEGLSDDATGDVPGFLQIEDTQIPQLQRHAQSLTEELRIAKHREVLVGICQILNSVSLWTQNQPGSSAALDRNILSSILDKFDREMSSITNDCINNLWKSRHQLLKTMNVAAGHGSEEAPTSVEGWFSIFHSTLKALFVRRGVWRTQNFNETLLAPFSTRYLHKWADVFHEVIPSDLDEFLVKSWQELTLTHKNIMAQIGQDEDEVTQIGAPLQTQLKIHQEGFKRVKAEVITKINNAQKLASRKPMQVVAEFMNPGYDNCLNEKGKGSMARMRNGLVDHVMLRKGEMFSSVVDTPVEILDKAIRGSAESMKSRNSEIGRAVRNDYMVALSKREESARHEEAIFMKMMAGVLEIAEPLLR